MLVINEWLPNPVGKDADGEWVELWNDGPQAAGLSGLRIGAGGKASAPLFGSVPENGFLVLDRADFRFALRNTDGELELFNNNGTVLDRVSFIGAAPEGKSASRMKDGRIVFTAPSPGSANPYVADERFLAGIAAVPGTELQGGPSWGTPVLAGLLCATMLTAAVLAMMKRDHALSELFFSGY